MTFHECERCNKLFTHKGNYTHHINRKIKCIENNNVIKNNLHNKKIINEVKYDIKIKKIPLSIVKIINKKNLEILQLKMEQSILLNIKNENTNNKSYINAFGFEENIHIDAELYDKTIKTPYNGILELIIHYHFNENMKENMNIRVLNKSSNYLEIFNGRIWITKYKDDVINELIISKKKIVDDYCNNNEIDLLIKKKYIDFSNNIDHYFNLNTVYKPIYRKLYNNINFFLINLCRIKKI